MNISIVVPVFNEMKSLQILADEICSVVSVTSYKYEIIFTY